MPIRKTLSCRLFGALKLNKNFLQQIVFLVEIEREMQIFFYPRTWEKNSHFRSVSTPLKRPPVGAERKERFSHVFFQVYKQKSIQGY